ncbi:ABC transporter permease [Paracraurococcus lichenis]|uniref:ABC transporter permease subunit n=1 Tax=Paracraurococcus lichenis TaxID=3064888 RepID=A0ABT9DZS2_9PROT|nr:ABC transporter permease subunit [Paracraurococcus sp. LOR1-02]MDO9709384.1 ABC transporter permease subunit [Paracraurococcus sp. LOR1-02]
MSDPSLALARPAASAPRRPHAALPRPLYGAAAVLAMLLAWWAVSGGRVVPAALLPSPAEVWRALGEILREGYRGTTLGGNILSTLGRLGGGFGLAVLTGVPLGLWMGLNRHAAAAIDWIIQFLRPLPPLSYMILLILWLGTGDASKTALLFLTAFPIVVAASAAGVRGVRRQRIQAAQALGASRAQVFRHIVLPSAAPMIFTGLQIALAAAFSTVVSAELMAATDGLGWMVISASHFLRNDVIILCILVLGLLGVALAWALRALDRRIVHWRGRD